MNKMLMDKNGNVSSKRIAGVSLLCGGGAMFITLFLFAIFKTVKDPETAFKSAQALIYAGAGLLGIGVVEMFGKKK